MNISTSIQQILQSLPEKPGVYQYSNSEGEIIYVGKAKNLKRRVSSYFYNPNQTFKTSQLVRHIADIKYIVVESEQDALLLENNLIKQYQPYYNILLKDGKSYPSICITNEPFPRVYKTRNIQPKLGEYYGPFSFSNSLDLVLELIHNLYPIRTCRLPLTPESIEKNKFKVCLKYHIKNCCGVCENYVSVQEYNQYIQQIRKIIKGDANEISNLLLEQMRDLAAQMKFEEAQIIKKKYDLIENFRSKTIITNTSIPDTDVFAYHQVDSNIFITVLHIHRGSIVKGKTVRYKQIIDEAKEDILARAIVELRQEIMSCAKDIIVPFMPDFIGENLNIYIPKQGDKRKLLQLAESNAKQYESDLQKQKDKLNPNQRSIRILSKLQDLLHLPSLPVVIESFDNSNIQGSTPVASCVVFRMGKPSKSDYRHYNIKSVLGADDYASMKEVVYRRYSRLIAENQSLPDLIVADGGVGQMNVIRQVVYDELSLDIPIAGLVKDGNHRTHTLLFGFPPQEISLSPTDELFHMLTHLQDEVHRFAISFHRQKRSANQTKSELDDISGIGPKTKKLLLQHFKSVKRIKEAKFEDIVQVIPKSKASVIYNYFHP